MANGNFNRYGAKGSNYHTKQQGRNFAPEVPERDVINPYTFIPMSEEEPARAAVTFGELSGYIDCRMTTKTPLFIPNTSADFSDVEMPEHKHRVFYSYTDLSGEKELTEAIRKPGAPVVPGSELRGMLRNVYEQLTNSCYVHIDENNLPFKRSAEPKVRCLLVWDNDAQGWRIYTDIDDKVFPGAIVQKNGKMVLEKGFKGRYDIDEQYKFAYRTFDTAESMTVSFDPQSKTITKTPNGEWYVHIPSKMKSKIGGKWTANRQLVYTAKGLLPQDGVLLSESVMERFHYVLGICEGVKGGYMDDIFNKSGDSKTRTAIYAKRYKQKKPLIVYADKNSVDKRFQNETIYLSPAAITKEFFGQTIMTILQKNANHQKCQSRENACPACRLFGMIGETSSLRGRVRCTDGEPQDFTYGEEITLPILATPKISATEFYLRRPKQMREDGVWNYDYYTTYRGNGRTMEFIRHAYTPTLSGRKVYVTHTPSFTAAPKSKMNRTVTPILSGSFDFRVYFDRLTKEELETLLFCIELTSGGKQAYHKIGAAKPMGWGAVTVTAENVTCISYQMHDGKIERVAKSYLRDDALSAEIQAKKEAVQIMKYALAENTDATLVRYPARPDKNGDRQTYLWFTKNRGSIAAPKIKQTLPHLDDENQKLKE